MARTKKTAEQRTVLQLNGIPVPVRIITERGRRATIASVRERALYIRLPHGLTPTDREKRLREMTLWAEKTAREKPEAFRHFAAPPVASAYTFDFRGTIYHIESKSHDRSRHLLEEIGEQRLRVTMSSSDTRPNPTRVLPKLLAKHFAGRYLPRVTRRVHALNEQHFRRPVREVRLSDTYSRWGSCSHRGNINLATRLLLAPDEVIDAVIIHELAHLIEANHSDRFWAQVARALPNYEEYDVWLKEHGGKLRFNPTPLP